MPTTPIASTAAFALCAAISVASRRRLSDDGLSALLAGLTRLEALVFVVFFVVAIFLGFTEFEILFLIFFKIFFESRSV